MSLQDFVDYRVFIENLGRIAVSLTLYITSPFSVAALIFFLYSVCLVLLLLCGEETFFWSSLFGVL